jgi:predicted transcriptional regulator
MQTLADYTSLPPLRVLVYGKAGDGKTEFAHNFPNSLTLDFDRGLLTVMSAIKAGRIKKSPNEIRFIQPSIQLDPRKDSSFDDVTEMLTEDTLEGIDTVIIDSASSLNNAVMLKALQENKRLGVSQSLAKLTKSGVIPTTQSDYGSAIQLAEKLVDFLISLDKNLIVICHEYPITNESGSTVGYRPLLLGQLRERLPAKFDEVYRMKMDNKGNRFVITQGKASFPAKSRLGCFEPEEPADFDHLISKVAKHYGVSKDELWRPETSISKGE